MEFAHKKRSPGVTEVLSLHREVGRLVDNMMSLSRPIVFVTEVWHPNVDVYETDDEILVLMDISGVSEGQISAEIEGDTLTIEGERGDAAPGVRVIHQREIEFGSFKRSIRLPAQVDRESVRAGLDCGFLQIRMKKAVPRSGRRPISIE